MDEWQSKIITNDDAIGSSVLSDYFREIKVTQLKRDGSKNENGIYTLHNAWPSSIDPMDLGFENSDTILEYGVTFSYSHWVNG